MVALVMLGREGTRQKNKGMTVGADRGYDTKDFVCETRSLKVTPRVAQKNERHLLPIKAASTYADTDGARSIR